jgi:hypothetical protein
MSRIVRLLAAALLAAATAWPGLAAAQMLPGNAAPPLHPGTRLNLPPSLGGGELMRSYTTPIGRSVLYYYQYSLDKVLIGVSLFDGGRRILAGSENPMVTSQFTSDLEAAEKSAKADGYTDFERPAVPSSCSYGGIAFRCIVYSVLAQRNRLYSKLLLTGYHDNFVRIRVDWNQGAGQTSADADRALKAFVPALMH